MSDAAKQPPMDFISENKARCHVYRMPAKLSNGYCFGGGHDIAFKNVDWFDAPIAWGREPLVGFIKGKAYFDPAARFLVLSDHPSLTFTIEPRDPAEGAGAARPLTVMELRAAPGQRGLDAHYCENCDDRPQRRRDRDDDED